MIFKRSNRRKHTLSETKATTEKPTRVDEIATSEDTDSVRRNGPFDIDEVNLDEILNGDDNFGVIDLKSIILVLTEAVEVQVEVQENAVTGVHLVVPAGRITISAYAAPRSTGQWRGVVSELADSLRADEAEVSIEMGIWGREVVGRTSAAVVRFIGVDGPRWMLRGVAVSNPQEERALAKTLEALFRETVVRRGTEALPVRETLPLTLPLGLAEQVAAAQQAAIDQQKQEVEDARPRGRS